MSASPHFRDRFRQLFVLVLLVGSMLISADLHASTFWFKGGTNGSLGTTGNWATSASGTTNGTTPGVADDTVFSVTTSNSIATNRWSMGGNNQTFASVTLSNSGANYLMRTSDAGATNSGSVNLTLSAGITNASGAGAFFLGDTDRRVLLKIAAGSGDFVIANNSASAVTFLDAVSLQTANSTNRTLRIAGTGAGNVVFSGGIDNGGSNNAVLSLRISNTGAVQLAASTFSGGTILDAGTIALSSGSALGTGALTINGGAIGSVTSVRTITNAISVAGNFSLGVTNAGYSGQSTTFNGNVDLGGATRTITMIANSATFGGVISNGGLTMNSASTSRNINITNAATYTGTTTVQGGNLVLSNGGALDTNNAVNLSATTTNATFDIANVAASGVTIGSLAGATNGYVNLGSKTLTVGGNNTQTTFSGVISNSGGLTKTGSGTLALGGANTYTGATVVNNGALAINAADRISDSSALTIGGGTFDLSSFNETVASLTQTSGTLGGSGTLTASTYALQGGTLTGNLGAGTATVTVGTTALNGTLGAGTVNINSGTMNLGSANRLSDSAAVTIAGGTLGMGTVNDTVGSLTISSGTLGGSSGVLTAATYALQGGTINAGLGAGAITVSSGTTTLGSAGRLNTSSSLTVNSGQLTLGGNETVASLAGAGGTVALGANGLTVNTTSSGTYSGAMSGSGGSLTKSGSGTVILAGTSTYDGATTVSAGKLVANGTNTSSAVTVSSGGTLGGSGQIGSLTVGGVLAPGNSVGTLSAGNTTFLGGGSFQLEMWDWTSTAGTGWDLLSINGDLALSNTSGSPFTISLVSMSSTNASGLSVNFNKNQSFTNTFVTYSGSLFGTSFNANIFSINTNNFQNEVNGTFSVTNVGGGLAILYTTAYAPSSTYAWSAGSGAWNTGANWTDGSAPTNGSSIVFSGAGGNSTNNAVDSIAGLTFSNGAGAYTVSGNALTNSAAGIVNNSASAQTINNDVVLGASQLFTNSGGALTIAGNVDVGGNALTVDGASNVVLSGVVSGSGSLTKSGNGALTLSGNNTITGQLSANAGSVQIDGTIASTNVSVSGANVTLGAANRLADSAAVTVSSGTLSAGGASDIIGTYNQSGGVLTNGSLAATTYNLSGGTVGAGLNGGAVNVSGSVSLSGTVTNGASVNVTNGGTLTFAANDRIGNDSTLAANGGQVNLGTFSDTVSVYNQAAGSVTNGSLAATTYNLSGGTVGAGLNGGAVNVSGSVSLSGTVTNGASVNVTNGGTLTLAAGDRLDNGLTVGVNGGTLSLGGFADTISVYNQAAGSITNGSLAATTYNLSGGTMGAGLNGGAVVVGGNVSLSGTVTNGASVNITNGTLTYTAADRIGNTSAVTNSGGVLDLGGFTDTVGSYVITGGSLTNGTLTASTYALQGGAVNGNLGTGTINASANAALNGTAAATTVNITGGTLTLGSASRLTGTTPTVVITNGAGLALGGNESIGTLSLTNGSVTGSGALSVSSSINVANGTISSGLAGAAGLTKAGSGTVILSGANTFSGAVAVNAGTLALTNGSALADSSAVTLANTAGAILKVDSNETIGSLAGGGSTGGAVALDVNTLTLNQSGSTSYTGTITGTGILAKSGAGTLTFNQASAIGTDFDMTINAGTVDLNRAGSAIGVLLGTGNNIVLNGGTVGFTASSAANGAITNGGISITADSSILVARTGTASSHSTTITAPLFFSNNANLSFTYNSVVTGGTTTFAGATNTLYSNGAMTLTNYNIAISSGIGESGGARSLTKNGAGTLILNGVNSYTGDTIVNGGELRVGAAGALSDSSLVNVSSGALASFLASDTIKGLSGAGNVSVASTTVLTLSNAANYTFSGAITNSGGLGKLGAGTQTLSTSNSYSGGTTIGEGMLAVGHNNALGTGSVTISNAATLAASGASALSNNVILGTGGGTITNASALSLAGTVTGGNTLTKSGAGTATFAGAIGASGSGNSVTLAINEGAASLSGSSIKYITNSTVASGATLIFNGGTVATRGGTSISGLGSVSVTSNTILSNSTANNTISSAMDIASGATLSFTNSSSFRNTLSGGVSGSGNIVILGGDTRFDTASNSFSGGVTINSGATGRLINAEAPAMKLTNNGTLIVDNSTGAKTYTNGIAGTGAVTVSGSGATALKGNISGSGLTVSATGSGNSLTLGGSNTFNGMTISGSVGNVYATSVFGLGTGTLSSTVSSARIAIDSSLGTGNSWTITNNVSAGATSADSMAFAPGAGNSIALSGVVSGSGQLKVSSGGDLYVANAGNTYTGGTEIGTGRILVGSDAVLGTGGTVNFGTATNSYLVSTSSFTLARNVTIGSSSQTGYAANIDSSGNNLTISGTVSDRVGNTFGGMLVKIGNGTLTLSASNSYTGGTLLSGGTLAAGNNYAFGTGGITVGSGTYLDFSTFTIANAITNNGGTILSSGTLDDVVATNGTTDIGGANSSVAEVGGSATVNVSGSNTTVAAMSGGTLNVNASGTVVTNYNGGNIGVSNSRTITLLEGASSGSISGAGGVTKSGSGTLTLSGNNTFTGATTVESGKLVVNGSSASATTVQSGATLGGGGTIASATIESGATINPGNSPGTLTLTNGLTWNAGGNYNWQIFDAYGTAGATDGWDLLAVTGGAFDITGLSSGNPFNINLWSLSGVSPDADGAVFNFDNTQNYIWELVSYTTLSGTFDSSKFSINTGANNGTAGFANDLNGGLFSLAADGDSLNLIFTAAGGPGPSPVPEPGTWAAATLLAGAAAYTRWRRRKA